MHVAEDFSVVVVADAVVLRRRVDCLCCKRKRAACTICGGSGGRTVDHPLADAVARRVAEELLTAIASIDRIRV